jgi:hypothetical protein
MIMRSPAVFTLLLVSLSGLVFSANAAPNGACTENTAYYDGWKIRSIQIKNPFDFFSAASSGFGQIVTALPLQQKNPFNSKKFDAGVEYITNAVKSRLIFKFATVRLVVTVNELENCDQGALDVRYVVYTAIVPSLSGKSFELRQAEVERPATTGASVGSSGSAASIDSSGNFSSIGSSGNFLVVPNFAYDHTRRGYGGAAIESRAPLKVFDTFKLDSSASSDSLVGDLALSAHRSPGEKYWNQIKWQLISSYRDLPVANERLKEGNLAAGFFGSTKELTSHGLIFNYGASLAGGHQQNTTPGAVSSSYGDLKLLAEVEDRWGSNAMAGAYGLQLGSTLSGRGVDFAKHIFDLRYGITYSPLPSYLKHPDTCKAGTKCDDRSAFIGSDHKPLSVEIRATGGLIQTLGVTPSVERFFGGNQQTAPFIEGEPWDVRDQPYIRSIPEYRIGSSNPASFGLGGTRFYSVNLTVAKAVIGRAILPKELRSTDFVRKLDGAMKTAEGVISDGYFGKDPAVVSVDVEVKALGHQVATLELPDPMAFDAATNERIGPIIKSTTLQEKLIAAIVTSITEKGNRNSTNALINSLVPALDTDLTGLRNVLSSINRNDLAAALEQRQTAIDAAKDKLVKAWKPEGTGGETDPIRAARERANEKAAQDMRPAAKVLNTVLYQLNAYSVAPVGIFDVARVWPSGVAARYAVGGGVRLSLVNANFTLGYALNPSRLHGEGPGALFFKLDITDLFH